MISKETFDCVLYIEKAISNEIDRRGRGMTPGEIASTVTAYALQELHDKLVDTLDASKEDRLELALFYKTEAEYLSAPPEKRV